MPYASIRNSCFRAGKTRSSILISCGRETCPFDIREVRELMEDDELELDTIGDEKTALFLIMSDTGHHLSISFWQWYRASLSTCFVTGPMINTAGGCPSMYG